MSGPLFSKLSVTCLALTVLFSAGTMSPKTALGQYPVYPQPSAWGASAYQNYNYGSYGKKIWDDRIMQAQLELSREQRRELLELKLEYDEVMGDLQLKMSKLSANQYTRADNGTYIPNKDVQKEVAEVRKRMSEINSDFGEKADKVLLPHQRKIRREAGMAKLVRSGLIQQLSAGTLDRHLKITPEQRKRIAERKKELDRKLKDQVAEMFAEIKDEMLEELDGEQREIIERAFEQYEYRADKNTFSLLGYETYFLKPKKKKEER